MNPYLAFGPGEDWVCWAALGAALVGFVLAAHQRSATWLAALPMRPVVGALALLAALLSCGYVAHYLRFGPRIVDATHYYLEARALAAGYLTFPVPEPTLAFRGRFLLPTPDGEGLGVLFPPGYPAALALAFRVGAPMALGPVLAGSLVLATYWLTRELGAKPEIARAAAALSAVCATLRYHTADTMSHGFAALLLALTVAGAARASRGSLVLSGLCLGWLAATRPVTFAVALLAALLLARRARWRLAWLAGSLTPGLVLLFAHQRAVTGSWLRSTQAAYYAVADGPPGCFRYGFGKGIGCLFEHGDFVRARLLDGYGVAEAAANTLRRLGVHALDIANAAPLAAATVFGAWLVRREPRARVAAGLVLGVFLAYAPFYFEGSYPGAGARFFADALPIEHAFSAIGLAALGGLRFAVPIALLGFALHTGRQHALLGEREGGRPMFEPAVLAARGIERGLVFVSTDHGFALGHEPGRLSAASGVVVARARHDATDRALWESLGRPAAYTYTYDAARPNAVPGVTAWTPPEMANTKRLFEAESLWPVGAADRGWAHPDFSAEPCVSRGRGLRLRGASAGFDVRLDLPSTGQSAFLTFTLAGNRPDGLLANWTDTRGVRQTTRLVWQERNGLCSESAPIGPLPGSGPSRVRLQGRTSDGSPLLDAVTLTGVEGKGVDN